MLFAYRFLPSELPFKMRLDMAIQNTLFFVEIMYNDNKGNSNSNSNSNSCYTSRWYTHNAYRHDIGNRLNEIVAVSSNPLINANCV